MSQQLSVGVTVGGYLIRIKDFVRRRSIHEELRVLAPDVIASSVFWLEGFSVRSSMKIYQL